MIWSNDLTTNRERGKMLKISFLFNEQKPYSLKNSPPVILNFKLWQIAI
jgi:hypothetical protein